METSELLKKVRKIEIKMKGISKHIFSGEYHSAFKGRGMSFSEVRNYQYGDDVRNIDWNVTARTGEAHIKVYEEERELTVMLLVDISSSSSFGTHEQFKREFMAEVSALLAFSADSNNDKVGLILFTDQVELYIPPKKGRQHILRIIRELLQFEPQSRNTDINCSMEYFTNVIKKRSICFVLSDYLSPNFTKSLQIAAKRHDIIGLHIFDEAEKELPPLGLLLLQDAETDQLVLYDSSNDLNRKSYSDAFQKRSEQLKTQFHKSGADFLPLNISEKYINTFLQFFRKRSHRA